jgi:hypothetical protein
VVAVVDVVCGYPLLCVLTRGYGLISKVDMQGATDVFNILRPGHVPFII